jgi:methylenetetrahydrofolate dehydrogenase (NADP+)/methenyltetrahydrofolate cyclohydrolase
LSAKILNGDAIAFALRSRIAQQIIERSKLGFRVPALAVILIGDNSASQIYVRNKRIACNDVGIKSIDYDLPATTSQAELLKLIKQLNDDSEVDGILVQLPLPKQINGGEILEDIDPHKDVDGFHPYNLGRLAQNHHYLRPCTPAGIMTMLRHTGENLAGKAAIVVGTSKIVGLPMILELINAGATVTACGKNTVNLAEEVARADIVVAATGNPELIKGEWIKPGAIVIDVGMNHTKNGALIGDVEFAAAKAKASWITPVPGGVGPMTIATLLNNTLTANINRQKSE